MWLGAGYENDVGGWQRGERARRTGLVFALLLRGRLEIVGLRVEAHADRIGEPINNATRIKVNSKRVVKVVVATVVVAVLVVGSVAAVLVLVLVLAAAVV